MRPRQRSTACRTVDVAAGLAEVVKCGFIADPTILDLVEKGPGDAVDPTSPVLRELVERAVRVKADVVARRPARVGPAGDPQLRPHARRTRSRRSRATAGDTAHAVAVGTVYAGALGELAGRLDADTAARHRTAMAALGLPVTYRADAWPDLLAAMRVDKKARGSRLRFVVLDGLAQPSILDGPSDELLAEAYGRVAA